VYDGCAVLAQWRRRNMWFSGRRVALAYFAALAIAGGGAGVPSGGASEARAADTAVAPENDASTATAPPPADQSPFGEKYYPAVAPTRHRPLMSLLDRTGLADPLDDARISLFGHAEASFEYNFMHPAGDFNAGREFDF